MQLGHRKEKRKAVALKEMETIRSIHRDWKFGNIFAIDRKQVRFQKLCCETEKNFDHLSSKQKNWKQNWKALVQAKISLHSNDLGDWRLTITMLQHRHRHRWHSHVVYMPNLVFHQRSERRYVNENTGTTRLFEQSFRSYRKAMENQRFTVASRQIYKNISTTKKFAKRVFLFR